MFRTTRLLHGSLGIAVLTASLAISSAPSHAAESASRRVSPSAKKNASAAYRVAVLQERWGGVGGYLKALVKNVARPRTILIGGAAVAADVVTRGQFGITPRAMSAMIGIEGLRFSTTKKLQSPADKHHALADLAVLRGDRKEAFKQRTLGLAHRAVGYFASNLVFNLGINTALFGPEHAHLIVPGALAWSAGMGVVGSVVEHLLPKAYFNSRLNRALGRAETAVAALDRAPNSEEAIAVARGTLANVTKAANSIPMLSAKQTARFTALKQRAASVPSVSEAASQL
ncbi:MAG: hypothetical protein IT371_06470 [Deltaproteobacteria bacterium]|nr:hypothetical protein [Deltaproteobacteria bacterium]